MKTINLTNVSLEEQRAMLPSCGLPSCSIESFTYVEQVYPSGHAFKVTLCLGHALQYRTARGQRSMK